MRIYPSEYGLIQIVFKCLLWGLQSTVYLALWYCISPDRLSACFAIRALLTVLNNGKPLDKSKEQSFSSLNLIKKSLRTKGEFGFRFKQNGQSSTCSHYTVIKRGQQSSKQKIDQTFWSLSFPNFESQWWVWLRIQMDDCTVYCRAWLTIRKNFRPAGIFLLLLPWSIRESLIMLWMVTTNVIMSLNKELRILWIGKDPVWLNWSAKYIPDLEVSRSKPKTNLGNYVFYLKL